MVATPDAISIARNTLLSPIQKNGRLESGAELSTRKNKYVNALIDSIKFNANSYKSYISSRRAHSQAIYRTRTSHSPRQGEPFPQVVVISR
jgi:hypothetical protein